MKRGGLINWQTQSECVNSNLRHMDIPNTESVTTVGHAGAFTLSATPLADLSSSMTWRLPTNATGKSREQTQALKE